MTPLESTRARSKKWRLDNPDKVRANNKQWADANPGYSAKWNREHPEKVKEWHLLREYGMSLDEHKALLVQQDNKCAICHREFGDDMYTSARVDHCHDNDVVRGLLCHKCNIAIGLFDDSIQSLENAVTYLARVKNETHASVVQR